jgi:hypothetical protein
MQIRKYDSEEHEQYLPDYHKPTYAEGDIDKFKQVAEEALEELESLVEFSDKDIELVIAITDTDEIDDNAPESYYFMGFSFDDGMRDHPGNAVFMRVTDTIEEWKAAMKDMLIHELGHQIFYQRDVDWNDNQYYSFKFEGYAENLAKIVAEKHGRNYNPIWRKDEPMDIAKDALFEDLKKPRTFGDEGDKIDHNMFVNGGSRWSNAEGYTIAYQLVRYLLNQNKITIQNMPEISPEDWKDYVDSAVKELY